MVTEITEPKKPFNIKKLFNLLVLLLIVTSIPLTVFLSQQQQEIRQRAAENGDKSKVKPRPEFVKGEIIVKFKATAEKIELKESAKSSGLDLEKNPVVISDIEERSIPPSLEIINRKHHLNRIEKVFKGVTDPRAVLDKIRQAQVSDSQKDRKINDSELSKLDFSKTFKFTFDKKTPVEQIVKEFTQNPDIEYAQPNYIYKINQISTPNDPYYLDSYPANVSNRDPSWSPNFDYQWDLKKIGMEKVWPMTQDFSEVKVAVIDTGVDYTHQELGGCTLQQVNDNQCVKVLPGYDFINNDSDAIDDNGHGTHVAGTIAALSNNSMGIAGIAPNAKIIPIKALNYEGSGWSDKLAQSIIYASDQGAQVINASWGGWGRDSLFEEAIRHAYFRNVVFVAAAGNSNDQASYFTPSNVKCETEENPDTDCVLTVASSDENDNKASYSNWGTDIDIAAPGGGNSDSIVSLKYNLMTGGSNILGNHYLRLRGTSMAAPHVAGFAALIAGKNPSLTALDIRNIIINGSDDLGLTSFDTSFGYGRINVFKALSEMNTTTPLIAKISSPQSETLNGRSIKVYGTASGSNFSEYKLEYALDNTEQWSNTGVTLEKSGRQVVRNGLLASVDLSGLNNGTYLLRLTIFSNNGSTAFTTSRFKVDKSIRANFPIKYGSSVHSQKHAIADLNGDGKKEIIFANTVLAQLQVIEPDGSNLSGWPKSIDVNGGLSYQYQLNSYSPVVADLDPQYSGLEVIIPVTKIYGDRFSIILIAFHADGTEVSGWTESSWTSDRAFSPSYYAPITASVVNINGKDAIVYIELRTPYMIKVHVLGQNGRNLIGWPALITLNDMYSNSFLKPAVISDVNKDGKPEIIVSYLNIVKIYSIYGVPYKEIRAAENIMYFSAADLDKDGFIEIIATAMPGFEFFIDKNEYYGKIYVWNYQGSLKSSKWPLTIRWAKINASDTTPLAFSLGDYNNDGRVEILTKTILNLDESEFYHNTKYHLLDVNANYLNGFPLLNKFNADLFANAMITNGNYLIAMTGGGTITGLQMYKYNFVSGLFDALEGFPKHFIENQELPESTGNASITDLENDGKLELVVPVEINNWGVVVQSSSYLYVYDLDIQAKFVDWSQYLHDERRTGAYVSVSGFLTPTPVPLNSPTPIPTFMSTPTPTRVPTSTYTPVPTSSTFTCNACVADINKTGTVDFKDYIWVMDCLARGVSGKDRYGNSCAKADLNSDGLINTIDTSCVNNNVNKKCTP